MGCYAVRPYSVRRFCASTPMKALKILEQLGRDPLSAHTHVIQRVLLVFSFLGIVIVRMGLVPTKISALGIEFSALEQISLQTILAWAIAYLWVTFLFSAIPDFVSSRVSILASVHEQQPTTSPVAQEIPAEDIPTPTALFIFAVVSARLRTAFEIGVPLLIGGCAFSLLLTQPVYKAPSTTPENAPSHAQQLTAPQVSAPASTPPLPPTTQVTRPDPR